MMCCALCFLEADFESLQASRVPHCQLYLYIHCRITNSFLVICFLVSVVAKKMTLTERCRHDYDVHSWLYPLQ